MQAHLRQHEPERLAAQRRYGRLDAPSGEALDDLARTVAQVCRAPIAAITLVDEDRHCLKSQIGLDRFATPPDMSLYAQAIFEADLFVLQDATKDERFAGHPMVIGEPFVRFYAGVPLETPDGRAVGALCVLDHQPRALADPDLQALRALARQVMALLELGRANAEQVAMLTSLDQVAKEKDLLLHELRHRVRSNLQTIETLVALQVGSEPSPAGRKALQRIQARLRPLRLIERQLESDDPLADVDLAAFLAELCGHLLEAHGVADSPVGFEARLEPTTISRERAVSVGLIVNEFVTNSFKHAFAAGGGRLSLTLRSEQDRVSLALADDGPGLHPDSHAAGLGLRLIPALVEQIDATASWHNGTGTQLIVTW
jgi:two-component sensor histidine kinase